MPAPNDIKDHPTDGESPVRIEPGPPARIVFAEAVGVVQAHALHRGLTPALDGAVGVTLDASRLERIDTAALQVLAAFCAALRSRGVPFRWERPSGCLQQSARLLGLEAMMGLSR